MEPRRIYRLKNYWPEYAEQANRTEQKQIEICIVSGTPERYFCRIKLAGRFITTGFFSQNDLI